jgi:hypothetical protein
MFATKQNAVGNITLKNKIDEYGFIESDNKVYTEVLKGGVCGHYQDTIFCYDLLAIQKNRRNIVHVCLISQYGSYTPTTEQKMILQALKVGGVSGCVKSADLARFSD